MTTPTTTTIAFALPVRPGQADLDREMMTSCWRGERRDQHAASRRRHGITRETVWLQATPNGELAIVLLESRDLAAALDGLVHSEDAFDAWFRDYVQDVHGVDLRDGLTPPETVLDYREA